MYSVRVFLSLFVWFHDKSSIHTGKLTIMDSHALEYWMFLNCTLFSYDTRPKQVSWWQVEADNKPARRDSDTVTASLTAAAKLLPSPSPQRADGTGCISTRRHPSLVICTNAWREKTQHGEAAGTETNECWQLSKCGNFTLKHNNSILLKGGLASPNAGVGLHCSYC